MSSQKQKVDGGDQGSEVGGVREGEATVLWVQSHFGELENP